jgi:hypothetical protein
MIVPNVPPLRSVPVVPCSRRVQSSRFKGEAENIQSFKPFSGKRRFKGSRFKVDSNRQQAGGNSRKRIVQVVQPLRFVEDV